MKGTEHQDQHRDAQHGDGAPRTAVARAPKRTLRRSNAPAAVIPIAEPLLQSQPGERRHYAPKHGARYSTTSTDSTGAASSGSTRERTVSPTRNTSPAS